ncbi:hypothetical protein NOR51B_1590 [Luminiphilus syltensis NOR5-1B]|uniref:Uncharacterized protein n=1 Tax=Luminiphilus syltensis NOR5-1B TaxID=565045 RepID=B8KQF8_9GAMM|nr:hypothetical protein NOR51B_1590 [Luminiphilus syltensis NOR5-1B]
MTRPLQYSFLKACIAGTNSTTLRAAGFLLAQTIGVIARDVERETQKIIASGPGNR